MENEKMSLWRKTGKTGRFSLANKTRFFHLFGLSNVSSVIQDNTEWHNIGYIKCFSEF
jgi:hypothetical protein